VDPAADGGWLLTRDGSRPKSYLGDVEETETQRKLLYVALTRAKRGAMLAVLG